MQKVSVITISLNNLSGLKRTFESVTAQDYPNLEYIIQDGGSEDGTPKFLIENEGKITFWASEKDGGVYEAMNQAVKKATGHYLLFLNSGDEFLGIDSISKLIEGSSGEDLVYGNLLVQEEKNSWIKTYPDQLNFRYFYFESLPHPASLISSRLFRQMGGYDTSLKIVSDWKFFLLATVQRKCTYRHVSEVTAIFYFDGVSSVSGNRTIQFAERIQTMREQFSWYFKAYTLYLRIIGKGIYPKELTHS